MLVTAIIAGGFSFRTIWKIWGQEVTLGLGRARSTSSPLPHPTNAGAAVLRGCIFWFWCADRARGQGLADTIPRKESISASGEMLGLAARAPRAAPSSHGHLGSALCAPGPP